MASFVIALVIGGLDVIMAVIITGNISQSRTSEDFKAQFFSGGLGMLCFNCMSLPACLAGAGLAVVGLIAHPKRNHLFTWIGLFGNGVVVLGVVGFYMFSWTIRPH
jgi:hypothetical protein